MISVCLSTLHLETIRAGLNAVFSDDTALAGSARSTPSAGHCAAVADIIFRQFGGELMSAKVNGESHWFNRIQLDGEIADVDLTGDQFGRSSVQVGPAGGLYLGTRVRTEEELNEETLQRAAILENRLKPVLQTPAFAALHRIY